MPSSACDRAHHDLHSFPTRRSSDLVRITGVIQAGGRSMRMGGEPKALLELGGKRIVERVVDALGAVLADLLVVTNTPERYAFLGLPRSEEHTSELQSLTNLVCRLLLATARTTIYTLSLHDALPIL